MHHGAARVSSKALEPDSSAITDLLSDLRHGESEALARVFTRVYEDLRVRARREKARFGRGVTLQTTGLVHEAYLKLVGSEGRLGRDRGHFLAIAARAMRLLLVDRARGNSRQKRGADRIRTDRPPEDLGAGEAHPERVLAVHEALERLHRVEPRLVRVVECRYFAGLTTAETAEAVGVSERTVIRSWRAAQAFLGRELRDDDL